MSKKAEISDTEPKFFIADSVSNNSMRFRSNGIRSRFWVRKERIDLWFEAYFVKEIRRVIEWLRKIKTANQGGTTLL